MASNQLPMFPLSIVVFPGEDLNLHIFEPRYRQLVYDCLKDDLAFGIPPYFEGKGLKKGAELRLIKVAKIYEDGTMDIKAKGIGWFEIIEFFRIMHGKLYPGGIIKRMPWSDESDFTNNVKLISLIGQLYDIMKITNVKIPPPDKFRTYTLAHKVGLNIDQELELLSITEEPERQLYLIDHLEHLIPIVREAENLRKRAELNGHFQNVISPDI
jgi:hypothetical protein